MKKLFLPVLFFSLAMNVCRGQQHKYYCDATVGGAFPVNGFAEMGGSAELGMTCNFSRNAGYSALLRWQTYKMNSQSITNSLKGAPPSVQWNVSAGNWQLESFMVGSDNAFPLSTTSRISLRVRLLLGCTVTTYPGMQATGHNGDDKYTWEEGSLSALSFSTLVGAGLQYKMKKNIYLSFGCHYFDTRPGFSNLLTTFSGPGNTVSAVRSGFSEEIKSLSTDLGVRIGF